MTGRKKVLVIGGPTASGKSGLALAIARQKNSVVINADSMQVYRGLPLLTAQPSPEETAQAPHALYACLDPEDACTAARWRDMALAEIESALADNRLPIVVGGTGFYIKTLLQGISPIPDIPPEVREKMAALQKKLGNPAFHAELKKRDPETAANLDPMNTQRNIRAFEVLEATGKGLSEWQKTPPTPPPDHLRFLTVSLLPPRETLYERCDRRFLTMLDAGALEEVKSFRETHPSETPLRKSLGYPELCQHLDGKNSIQEAAAAAQQSTRNYAKRQVTWFRHQITADITLKEAMTEKIFEYLQ